MKNRFSASKNKAQYLYFILIVYYSNVEIELKKSAWIYTYKRRDPYKGDLNEHLTKTYSHPSDYTLIATDTLTGFLKNIINHLYLLPTYIQLHR